MLPVREYDDGRISVNLPPNITCNPAWRKVAPSAAPHAPFDADSWELCLPVDTWKQVIQAVKSVVEN